MCVIAVSLKGKKLEEEKLRKMWNSNSHGAGIAIIDKKKNLIIVKKGLMTFENFLNEYKKVPEGIVHAIHFRLASAGGRTPQMTHPFRVDRIQIPKMEYTAKAVLFHNGTVRNHEKLFLNILPALPKKTAMKILDLEDISDTFVVSLYVARLGHKVLKYFSDDRWVVMTPTQFIFYGHWHEEDDFKFSNMSWNYSFRYIISSGSSYTDCPYEDDFSKCPYQDYYKCKSVSEKCPYKRRL
jgi:predicted glutamine amidotransferase